jgi:hypothetical protein
MLIAGSSAWRRGVGRQPFTVVYAVRKPGGNPPRGIANISPPRRATQTEAGIHAAQRPRGDFGNHRLVHRSPGRPLLMLSLFRDVTTQRRLEEQLRQSQKMEAIGQLAGGVAHDFNNILTVIHGHASLLRLPAWTTPARAPRSRSPGRRARRRADAATAHVQPPPAHPAQEIGHEQNRRQHDRHARAAFGRGRDAATELQPSPATVEADAGMMEQVLLNLAVNARDAMPRGGQLAVRISIVDVNEDHVQRHPEARTGLLSASANPTPAAAFRRKIFRAFSSRFSRPRKSARAPAWAWRPFMALSNSIRAGLKWKASSAKAPPFAFTSRSSARSRPSGKTHDPDHRSRRHRNHPAGRGRSARARTRRPRPPKIRLQNFAGRHRRRSHRASGPSTRNEIPCCSPTFIMPGNMNGRELAEKNFGPSGRN